MAAPGSTPTAQVVQQVGSQVLSSPQTIRTVSAGPGGASTISLVAQPSSGEATGTRQIVTLPNNMALQGNSFVAVDFCNLGEKILRTFLTCSVQCSL